ncbi:MAG: gliding motility-associated C-terminal domain-containing protein [Bacteroidetes bacterium]|nr:gliding motility-associated C-terminal domain-containing protein [Bacteroidota bacterium]MBS1931176.1 gliding motility-associated C-terminal domain-containing protein [Bacteroidota bacterium]
MDKKIKIVLLCVGMLAFEFSALSQSQSCPANVNFAAGDISSWSAQTGLVNGPTQNYPAPNSGVSIIREYSINTTGIQVITSSSSDRYGGFPTIPVINGYSYGYSVKIGSDATSWDLQSNSRNPGGFTRSITYAINVPPGPVTVPYTMTYAYAMVLENGTHNSNEQPLFKATLSTPDSVVTCASPQYYLPTFNNAGGGGGTGGGGSTGATLDTASALANGFSLSPVFFLSHAGTGGNAGTYLQDVWTKGWTEVTFDLSAYRGRTVSLTFEADNCVPGAHFAYAYVALRDNCAGLQISGSPIACTNASLSYSVPALANGSYSWTVPAGWTINSGGNTNIINVTVGNSGGAITVHEQNGCADLRDTINVTTTPPTLAGQVNSNNTVCTGSNSTTLTLSGERGNILNWISTKDGVSWNPIANTTNTYTAQNLTATTQFAAVIQNGNTCSIDSSNTVVITVDPKSVGGALNPSSMYFCAGQSTNSQLTLSGNTGTVLNWQASNDSVNWNNFAPANTNSSYNVNSINTTTYYRTIVKSGVCPADTSAVATLNYINTPYPDASINPASAFICYGTSTSINATINIGTSYTWTNANTLQNPGTGVVGTVPYIINATAFPPGTSDYILTVSNAGCPNAFMDTFHVDVTPRIIVFAGNDTSIVANQPLQLNATVNTPSANIFNWTPGTGLNFTNISNPIANLGPELGDYITYTVRATDSIGCYAEDDIKVTIFKTGPDIFVPSAFTPNGDGKNDIIKPICVGISKLNYFRIYNRWGQMVFSTSQMGKGWDGTIGGSLQSTGNFVYMAQGIDYTGKVIFKKGNVTLIR